MNAADKLWKDYEDALADLQAKCHHEWGVPREYMWAPGHYGGLRRWCIHCNKMFKEAGEV